MKNFLRPVLFIMVALMFCPIAVKAAAWSDQYQAFDDNFNNDISTQYTNAYNSPVISYVSPNQLSLYDSSVGMSMGAYVGGVTTPESFVWTSRWNFHEVGASGAVYWFWNYSSLSIESHFACQQGNNSCTPTVNGVAGAAGPNNTVPAGCFTGANWCWSKIIRTGQSATLFIAPDNSGQPGTYVKAATANNFTDGSGSYFVFGVYYGTLLVGGDYPCVNHISSNANYDCVAFEDQKLKFNDNFYSSSPYTGGSVSSSTLNIAASSYASFQPFGSVSMLPDFSWILRVNSQTQDGTHGAEIGLFSDIANLFTGSHNLYLEFATSPVHLYQGTNGANAAALVATATGSRPTPPYYLKFIYQNGSLTVYDASVTSVPIGNLTWSTLIPKTDISSYTLGTWFGGMLGGGGATEAFGGGNQYACENYFSLNPGWDCFSQALYLRTIKRVQYPLAIYYDSFNDASKLSADAGSFVVSGGYATGGTSNNYQYYASTNGFQNQAVLLRLTNITNASTVGPALRNVSTSGYYTRLELGQLCVSYFNGGGFTNKVCNTPNSLPSTVYLYSFINGTTVTALLFNEFSPGVIGNIIDQATTTAAGNATGSILISSLNTTYKYGGGFPISMYNYGASSAPSYPPFGGVYNLVQNFVDNFFSLSQESFYVSGCTGTTPGTLGSGNSVNIPSGTCMYPSILSSYQNSAAVIRTQDSTATASTRLWLKLTSAGTAGIAAYTTTSTTPTICVASYASGFGTPTCSGAVGVSATGYYDMFGSILYTGGTYNYTVYAQLCPEISAGIPDYTNCVGTQASETQASTVYNTSNLAFQASGGAFIVGGAWPFFQARDYGSATNVPQTLSTFFRGY
jgi:hypothetical protein